MKHSVNVLDAGCIFTDMNYTIKHLLVVALLFGSAVCSAQSRDSNSPTALGPGVNKGNIDNMGSGPYFYYFTGGPGKFDVHYRFHEMGVLGNPFRQVLTFDVLGEKNKLLAHDVVQSMGKLETFTHPGDTAGPVRFVIRVTAQNGLIRLGGYYEIEITGLASFDGKTAGADVAPQMSPTLVNPSSGPLVKSGGPLVQPSGALVHPSGPLVQSSGPLVHPSGPLVQASVPLVQPVGALVGVQFNSKEIRLTLAADILFDFGQATIRPDAKEALSHIAEVIRSNETGVVRIEGFTDSKGGAEYNLRLSRARAEAVEKWLVEREGLAGQGLSATGLGASHFTAPNNRPDGSDDPEGRQKNRRVEVVVPRTN